jgi:hypothetical protein
MFELTELLSSWWGALVIFGLILLNSIALAGYWGRYQIDRRFGKAINEESGNKNARIISRGEQHSHHLEVGFFEDWSNRIYFMLTMGCALLLISLPVFPIDNRSRFLLWMALTVSTMFGVYRIYLAWYGRDSKLRAHETSGSSKLDYEESLDRLSETDKPSRLLSTQLWIDKLWKKYLTPYNNRVPISLIGFMIIGHEELEQDNGRLAADRITVIIGEAVSKALRDDDLVCQAERDRFFAALIDCPQSNLPAIGDRLTKSINETILQRASKIYETKMTLVYFTLDISDMYKPEVGRHIERDKEEFFSLLKEKALHFGGFS